MTMYNESIFLLNVESLCEFFTPFQSSLQSAHSSIMSATNTIKFNVGGKHFEVSRDLMEMHSETMLGKLVSEAWQQDPEESVFIDRNGDTFAYVLDYLRYGR